MKCDFLTGFSEEKDDWKVLPLVEETRCATLQYEVDHDEIHLISVDTTPDSQKISVKTTIVKVDRQSKTSADVRLQDWSVRISSKSARPKLSFKSNKTLKIPSDDNLRVPERLLSDTEHKYMIKLGKNALLSLGLMGFFETDVKRKTVKTLDRGIPDYALEHYEVYQSSVCGFRARYRAANETVTITAYN